MLGTDVDNATINFKFSRSCLKNSLKRIFETFLKFPALPLHQLSCSYSTDQQKGHFYLDYLRRKDLAMATSLIPTCMFLLPKGRSLSCPSFQWESGSETNLSTTPLQHFTHSLIYLQYRPPPRGHRDSSQLVCRLHHIRKLWQEKQTNNKRLFN